MPKTKAMVSKAEIKLGTKLWTKVNNFCYVGNKVTKDGRSKLDVKCRIIWTKKAFFNRNVYCHPIELTQK